VFPSFRQLALICVVWATIAWYTVAMWSLRSASLDAEMLAQIPEAFTHFYALRAPVVGAVAGLVWAPVFSLGYHPGRVVPGHDEGRDVVAEDPHHRHRWRFIRGAIFGQFVGATATFALLFLWPNEMQNSRWDAVKWGLVFWRLNWFLFVPAAAGAGVLSVWMSMRHRFRPTLWIQ
jgi:hypothetical protein